jgi:hypothetical protein
MSSQWHKISIEQAELHPLYGVKNWVLVFAFGILIGGLMEMSALSGEAYRAGMTLQKILSIEHPTITFIKLTLTLRAVSIGIIYWLLFSKSQSFRKISSFILLVSWPLIALFGALSPFDGLTETLGCSFLLWLVSCGVWVTYLQKSRRVRVTFEQCIRLEVVNSLVDKFHSGPIHTTKTAELHGDTTHPRESIATKIQQTVAPVPSVSLPTHPSDELWAYALVEFDGPDRRLGLWAKLFSASQGNESQAKARYLEDRVSQMMDAVHAKSTADNLDQVVTAQATQEKIAALKKIYLSGAKLNPIDVAFLARASATDETLSGLVERFKGETLLHWCARYGLGEEAQVLFKHGANASIQNGNGQQPFALTDDMKIKLILFNLAGANAASVNTESLISVLLKLLSECSSPVNVLAIICALEKHGFDTESISLVVADRSGPEDAAHLEEIINIGKSGVRSKI